MAGLLDVGFLGHLETQKVVYGVAVVDGIHLTKGKVEKLGEGSSCP